MAPLIVIGIDGLPPALLDRLLAEDRMPVLRSLRDGGCARTLRSTPNYQSASAWTSLVTGVNPGKHGILHFTNPIPGGYGHAQIDSRAVRSPTIWRLLSDAEVKVAALNVPVSFPVEPVNGVMIAGWLCPSPGSDGFTHPPELATEIIERRGDYPIHPDVRRHVRAGRYARAVEVAAEGIRAKLAVARWLLRRECPDLLWVVTTEIDSLQHWCWDLIDEGHPEHCPRRAGQWREKILSVYETLDEQAGRLLEEAGPDANVLIVSDHGQAPNSGAQVLLRPWLMDAGYLVPQGRSVLRRGADALLRGGFEMLRSRAPNHAKAWLRARLAGMQSQAQAGVRGAEADRERTRAWTEAGHVFINLRGCQPMGIVEPGEEFEAVMNELSDGLRELRDAQTGRRVVAEVTRGDAVFHGPQAEVMPDLLVHWRNDLRVRKLIDRSGGRERVIERRRAPALPPGTHHPDGTLVAAGPSFRTGIAEGEQSVDDIAPTLLHLLGQPVQGWFDGRVMTELLTGPAAKDVKRGVLKEGRYASDDRPCRRTDRDVAEIEHRLRSLGYLD